MSDILVLEDPLTLNGPRYDINFVHASLQNVYCRGTKRLRPLSYTTHIRYVTHINGDFQSFHCPIWGVSFNRTFTLEHLSTESGEGVEAICPRNLHQIRRTPFHKLEFFGTKYTSLGIFLGKGQNSFFNQFVFKERLSKVQKKKQKRV